MDTNQGQSPGVTGSPPTTRFRRMPDVFLVRPHSANVPAIYRKMVNIQQEGNCWDSNIRPVDTDLHKGHNSVQRMAAPLSTELVVHSLKS